MSDEIRTRARNLLGVPEISGELEQPQELWLNRNLLNWNTEILVTSAGISGSFIFRQTLG